MFHENAQENIGAENMFGMYWIIVAVILIMFLIFDFLCLLSRRRGKENSFNEGMVIMSFLIKIMMVFLAIVYFIIV